MSPDYTQEVVLIEKDTQDIVATESFTGDFFPVVQVGHIMEANDRKYIVEAVHPHKHNFYGKTTTRYYTVRQLLPNEVPSSIRLHESLNRQYPDYSSGYGSPTATVRDW